MLGQSPQKGPADAPADAPRLKLSTDTWDFGTLWQGQPAKAEITLTNGGGGELHIRKVRGSCGCTQVRVTKNVLASGESCILHVAYDTHRRDRKVHKLIRIETDDPQQPKHVVRVRGEVRPLLNLDPPTGLNFANLKATEPATRTMNIHSQYATPLTLKLAESPEKPVRLELEEITAGRHWRLTATTVPPLKNGPISATATLETGIEVVPSVKVKIRGLVQPPVAVTPARLYVVPHASRAIERTLRLIVRDEQPVQITSVDTGHPNIRAEILPAAPGSPQPHLLQIRVTLPPADKLLPDGATLTIHTTHPQSPELKVPIRRVTPRARPASAEKEKRALD